MIVERCCFRAMDSHSGGSGEPSGFAQLKATIVAYACLSGLRDR